MKFATLYEITVPRKWGPEAEARIFHEVVEQVQFAAEMGFDAFWTVEHYFLDEFSHCSAPEVLAGVIAAKTKKIRIGHGVRLLPFPYNHPCRVAGMSGTLDILCNGRLEFGTGNLLRCWGSRLQPSSSQGQGMSTTTNSTRPDRRSSPSSISTSTAWSSLATRLIASRRCSSTKRSASSNCCV